MVDTQFFAVFHHLNVLDDRGPFVYFGKEAGAQGLNSNLDPIDPGSTHLNEVSTRDRCPYFSKDLEAPI